MDRLTKLALCASISLWELRVELLKQDKLRTAEELDCPLCMLFNNPKVKTTGNCQDCPVFAKTGKLWCQETPYLEFEKAPEGSQEEIAAGQAEVDFLRSLLPPENSDEVS